MADVVEDNTPQQMDTNGDGQQQQQQQQQQNPAEAASRSKVSWIAAPHWYHPHALLLHGGSREEYSTAIATAEVTDIDPCHRTISLPIRENAVSTLAT